MIMMSLCLGMGDGKDPATTLLNEWPIIMAHDAATTYLEGGFLHQINDWTKTQPDGGPIGLLNCGARAFDWRPLSKDGKLMMHHGSQEVDYPMILSLRAMEAWSAHSGRNESDLVVLGITDCNGFNCTAMAMQLLDHRNITYIHPDQCGELEGMTVSQAFEKARLPNGGAILAIFDCWASHYDETVACSGFGNTEKGDIQLSARLSDTERARIQSSNITSPRGSGSSSTVVEAVLPWPYTCYTDSSTKAFPLQRMWEYVDKTTKEGPPADGQLWTTQVGDVWG